MVGIVATVWKDKKLVSFLCTQCEIQGNQTMFRKQRTIQLFKCLQFLLFHSTTSTWACSWCAFLTFFCAFLTSKGSQVRFPYLEVRFPYFALRFPSFALSLLFPGLMWNGKIKMLGHSACVVEYENVFSFAF